MEYVIPLIILAAGLINHWVAHRLSKEAKRLFAANSLACQHMVAACHLVCDGQPAKADEHLSRAIALLR